MKVFYFHPTTFIPNHQLETSAYLQSHADAHVVKWKQVVEVILNCQRTISSAHIMKWVCQHARWGTEKSAQYNGAEKSMCRWAICERGIAAWTFPATQRLNSELHSGAHDNSSNGLQPWCWLLAMHGGGLLSNALPKRPNKQQRRVHYLGIVWFFV